MEFAIVGTGDLPQTWPLVRQFVIDGLTYSGGRFSEKNIVDGILIGAMQLWIVTDNEAIKMAMVTKVSIYPTGLRVCEAFVLGGTHLKEWIDFAVDHISHWAKGINCAKLELIGRPGWEKVLKGWGRVLVMLERPLGGQHE